MRTSRYDRPGAQSARGAAKVLGSSTARDGRAGSSRSVEWRTGMLGSGGPCRLPRSAGGSSSIDGARAVAVVSCSPPMRRQCHRYGCVGGSTSTAMRCSVSCGSQEPRRTTSPSNAAYAIKASAAKSAAGPDQRPASACTRRWRYCSAPGGLKDAIRIQFTRPCASLLNPEQLHRSGATLRAVPRSWGADADDRERPTSIRTVVARHIRDKHPTL